MAAGTGDVTLILEAIKGGDTGAQDRLFSAVYSELKGIAPWKMAAERPGHTPNATALVHEAYPGLAEDDKPGRESRAHFFGASAEALRRLLIDRARQRQAQKHGGDRTRVGLEDNLPPDPENAIDILALNEALEKLEARDERRASVAKYRGDSKITVASVLCGRFDHPLHQPWLILGNVGASALGGRGLSEYPACPSLRDAVSPRSVPGMSHGPVTLRRAQKFPEAASFSIALSSADSSRSFLSRTFSFASSFSRLSWSLRRPPYSVRQR